MSENSELPSGYDPTVVEKRLYDWWEKEGLFKADAHSKKEPYVIVFPPPNVTGVLHMGHALTATIEDILIRRARMQGKEALWVPGTDHAGIATQMVVERNLMKESKTSRHDLGREKFLEKVWEWKESSQATITDQMRRLGGSFDWSRLAFTLDEGVSRAVRTTFKKLYDEKLLYRDEALIQWCPRCRTALSDLEVKPKPTKGKFYHITYGGLVVATTRPETLLGDTAVAVHPEDDRYKQWIGKKVRVPLTDRDVPVIGDTYVDKEFGTGALKITPGHDLNDYAVGKKHGLPILSIFDDEAKLNALAGKYAGLTREKAREQVVEDLKAQGLLVKEVDHDHNVGSCDRCGTIVEPRLSAQWFVNAEVLAKPAIEAVRSGKIRILPEEWEKTYFQWMENIRPWCVSRQLWWGHRIPVWYCKCGFMNVSVETPEKCGQCSGRELRQDDDVLDTWFSSGLWPFSTLGWPEKTDDLKKFYPNAVMETGFDILFFWVARMIMLGIKMMGEIPFHTVYLHPMVRDEFGQKMSKTKGNVKDPLEIISRIGADPLRFTLAAMSVHGRDVLLSDQRIEGYRNFVTKIWNASRFVLMHFTDATGTPREDDVNLWIRGRLEKAKKEVNEACDAYRFFDAANTLYHFFWSEFCDWYLEFLKVDIDERKAARDTTPLQILDEALRLLHPLMPFVTEEIWQRVPGRDTSVKSISLARYPTATGLVGNPAFFDDVIATIEALRSKRGECNVNPGVKLDATFVGAPEELKRYEPLITKLAGLGAMRFAPKPSSEAFVVIPVREFSIFIPREELIDLEEERKRVGKELDGKRGEHLRAKQKLESHEFVNKAPPAVIEGVKTRREALEREIQTLESYLATLK